MNTEYHFFFILGSVLILFFNEEQRQQLSLMNLTGLTLNMFGDFSEFVNSFYDRSMTFIELFC